MSHCSVVAGEAPEMQAWVCQVMREYVEAQAGCTARVWV